LPPPDPDHPLARTLRRVLGSEEPRAFGGSVSGNPKITRALRVAHHSLGQRRDGATGMWSGGFVRRRGK
jgi:hypothetical protein